MIKIDLLLILITVLLLCEHAGAVTCQTSGCHNDMKKNHFVHGPVRANGCKICHQVTGKNYGELSEEERNLFYPLKMTASLEKTDHPVMIKLDNKEVNAACVVCHDELTTDMKNHQFIHKAIDKDSCIACHNPHSGNNDKFLKTTPPRELCMKCHEIKTGTKFHNLAEKEKDCLVCHAQHTSKHEHLLKKSTMDTCLSCHDKNINGKNGRVKSILEWTKLDSKKLHTPAGKQECAKCHEVHGSEHTKLLKKDFEPAIFTKDLKASSKLCFSCHKEELISLKQVTAETNFRNGNKNLHFFHGPDSKKIKNCYACHDIHGSPQDFLIKGNFEYSGKKIPIVYKKLPNGGSCATACHKTMEYNREKEVNNVRDP